MSCYLDAQVYTRFKLSLSTITDTITERHHGNIFLVWSALEMLKNGQGGEHFLNDLVWIKKIDTKAE